MKITGGVCRGRPLFSLPGNQTRPTSGKIRQALFNILGPVEGDSFLDCFAGTGSVGLEALSRGAQSADFVEKHRGTTDLITANLEHLKLRGGKVYCGTAEGFLKEQQGKQWDLVFVDPPFVKDYPLPALWKDSVKEKGALVFQYPTKCPPPWFRTPDKTYGYGESSMAFFYY